VRSMSIKDRPVRLPRPRLGRVARSSGNLSARGRE
jgi:hypothetical protein